MIESMMKQLVVEPEELMKKIEELNAFPKFKSLSENALPD